MTNIIYNHKFPLDLGKLTNQVDDVYNQLECCGIELGRISYLPAYEQLNPMLKLTHHLEQLSLPLKKLVKKIEVLLTMNLSETLLDQVDALRDQLDDLSQVHHLLIKQVMQLKCRLNHLDAHFNIPCILMN